MLPNVYLDRPLELMDYLEDTYGIAWSDLNRTFR